MNKDGEGSDTANAIQFSEVRELSRYDLFACFLCVCVSGFLGSSLSISTTLAGRDRQHQKAQKAILQEESVAVYQSGGLQQREDPAGAGSR